VAISRRERLGRRYWQVWVATTASNLGDGLTLVAMPLLAASFTTDPITIAGVGVFTPLAKIVVSLGGGVLVDRADRRRLMFGADILRLLVMVGFTVLVASDDVSFVAVYGVVFILAVGEFLFDASSIAVVRDIVPRSRLTGANGWLYAAEDGAQDLAAPPLAAILFTVATWVPFLVDGATFALSAILVLSLRGRFRAERQDTPPNVREDLREGFGFIRHRRFFRSATVVWTTLGFTLGLALATLVLFVLRTLHADELAFAALVTAGAVGIVVGNLATARLERAFRAGGVLVGAVVVGGVALLLTGLASVLVVAAAAQVIWGVGFGLANTQMVSVRQRLVPDELLGRITGIFGLASSVGMVVGAVAGGILTDLGNPRVPLLVAGVVQASAGIGWWVLLRLSGGLEQAARSDEEGARA
jgi:MFS family permease